MKLLLFAAMMAGCSNHISIEKQDMEPVVSTDMVESSQAGDMAEVVIKPKPAQTGAACARNSDCVSFPPQTVAVYQRSALCLVSDNGPKDGGVCAEVNYVQGTQYTIPDGGRTNAVCATISVLDVCGVPYVTSIAYCGDASMAGNFAVEQMAGRAVSFDCSSGSLSYTVASN